MSTELDFFEELDQLDEHELFDQFQVRNAPRKRGKSNKLPKVKHVPKVSQSAAKNKLTDEAERTVLDFSYKASKTEALWLDDSLRGFYDQRWFDDVLTAIKGGKEASVYQLKGNSTTKTDFLAAKVYRPRMFRNLRNDHMYREGRLNLDSDGLAIVKERPLKAIRKRTTFGKSLLHTSWLVYEVTTMRMLKDAGCDVPIFYASGDNAILMEYIGGPDMAAPTLNTVNLSLDEANRLFRRVLHNIERMLANDRIHGDLSAFNILYWDGAITLIDFPQAITPTGNRNAYRIFERDVTRVCEYFIRQGVHANPKEIAQTMWKDRNFRFAPEPDLKRLDPENEEDVAYWEAYGEEKP